MIDNMCPPEIVIDRPCSANNWKWEWGVYQPDAHWAPLAEGTADSREWASRAAADARKRIVYERYGTYDM